MKKNLKILYTTSLALLVTGCAGTSFTNQIQNDKYDLLAEESFMRYKALFLVCFEVEMCGNGARAITAFAHEVLSIQKELYHFETMNSLYECSLDSEYGFKLKMTELYDVDKIKLIDFCENLNAKNCLYMNTGVPHAVFEISQILDYPVFEKGKLVRYDSRFIKGSNANFFEVIGPKHLRVRTYERGVENETLSCGTGATATALAAARFYGWSEEIILETLGGRLAIKFSADLSSIYLCGKVDKIFSGSLNL